MHLAMNFDDLLLKNPVLIGFFPGGRLPDPANYLPDSNSFGGKEYFNEVDECTAVILPSFFSDFPSSNMNLLEYASMCVTIAGAEEDWGLFGVMLCFAFYVSKYTVPGTMSYEVETTCSHWLEKLVKEKRCPIDRKMVVLFADEVLGYDGGKLRSLVSTS